MTFSVSLHILPANAILNVQIYFSLQYWDCTYKSLGNAAKAAAAAAAADDDDDDVIIMMTMIIIIIIQKMRKKHNWKHNIKELQKTAILSTAHLRWEVLT